MNETHRETVREEKMNKNTMRGKTINKISVSSSFLQIVTLNINGLTP